MKCALSEDQSWVPPCPSVDRVLVIIRARALIDIHIELPVTGKVGEKASKVAIEVMHSAYIQPRTAVCTRRGWWRGAMPRMPRCSRPGPRRGGVAGGHRAVHETMRAGAQSSVADVISG